MKPGIRIRPSYTGGIVFVMLLPGHIISDGLKLKWSENEDMDVQTKRIFWMNLLEKKFGF